MSSIGFKTLNKSLVIQSYPRAIINLLWLWEILNNLWKLEKNILFFIDVD